MSGDRDDLRELLIELEYGELDAAEREAAQKRIDEHPNLIRMQQAFRAVHDDLADWEEIEGQPARIAFVTMPGEISTNAISTFGWMKGGAVAASFVLGILLFAAFASTSLTRTDTGWTLSTGLSRAKASLPAEQISQPTASTSVAGQAQTGQASVGRVPAGPVSSTSVGSTNVSGASVGGAVVSSPAVSRSAGGQAQPFRMSRSQFGIDPLLIGAPADRERQLRILVREMVAAAEQRQQQQMDSLLTDLYQTFDTQRTSDLSVVFDELGLLRSSTGLELQHANEVIDFLVTRIGGDMEPQAPEQRDD